MAVAVQPHVRCPRCGSTRVLSPRHARRVRAGVHNGLCSACRGVRREVSEPNLRFWLDAYQAPCPAKTPVRQFIAAGGAPDELVTLARTIWPTD